MKDREIDCRCCLQSGRNVQEMFINPICAEVKGKLFIDVLKQVFPDLKETMIDCYKLCNRCSEILHSAYMFKLQLLNSQKMFKGKIEIYENNEDEIGENVPKLDNNIDSNRYNKMTSTRRSTRIKRTKGMNKQDLGLDPLKMEELDEDQPMPDKTPKQLQLDTVKPEEEQVAITKDVSMQLDTAPLPSSAHSPVQEEPAADQIIELINEDPQLEFIGVNQYDYENDKTLVMIRLKKKKPSPTAAKRSVACEVMSPIRNPHPCTICGDRFAKEHLLKDHLAIHTEEKHHECKECDKTFTTYKYLKAHQKIHALENRDKFKCNLCGKCCASNNNLKVHMNVHSKTKPYQCKYCDKCFTDPSYVLKHQRKHVEDRPFKCKVCNKTYTDPSAVTRHMRVHTNVRPYKCEVCEKTFRYRNSYKIHMKAHNEKGKFSCQHCAKTFRLRSELTKHIKVNHISKTKEEEVEKE